MKYTIGKRKAGWDSANLYLDGVAIGFVGDDCVGLERCPECGAENYMMVVLSGACAFCGWEIDRDAVERVNDEA